MEQSLERSRVGRASRTNHDLDFVLQRDDAFLAYRVCSLRSEILVGSNVAQFFGCAQQFLTPTWMCDLDQCHCSFPDRFPEQVRNAVLSDHVMHVRPRDPHPIADL